jgi:hypothetical protein
VRVFVLGTGRCGTLTFARAVESTVTNYTAGHETRCRKLGEARLDYPDAHVEADNRLSWFLGPLVRRFGGEDTMYIHLKRDPDAVAASYAKRLASEPLEKRIKRAKNDAAPAGIMPAFGHGILMHKRLHEEDHDAIARTYVATVVDNVDLVVRTMPLHAELWIDRLDAAVVDRIWQTAGFVGDQQRFLDALHEVHHASE